MVSLSTPVESVPRVSRKIVPALKRLGVKTARDLLFHFPARYDDFSDEKNIGDVNAEEIVTITGVIKKIFQGRTARRGMTLAQASVADETGSLSVIWFRQPFLARTLKAGNRVRLSGKTSYGPRGLVMQNPAYEKIPNSQFPIPNSQPIHTGGLIPVYPETAGITSRWIRFLVHSLLPLTQSIADPLPDETRERHGLPPLFRALEHIHFPKTRADAAEAERRFIFEDLLFLQMRSLRERSRLKQAASPEIPFDIDLVKQFVASLPFALTDAQRRSLYEIGRDMARNHPMNRLLEGDVGSGKTVVAAAASLLAIRAGYRVAFMAPTEILARQHYETLARVLAPFHISTRLKLGGGSKSKKESPSAPADITVGTHALIQKNMELEKLGLAVVDEQHRFGVSQRRALIRGHTPTVTQTKADHPFPCSSASRPRESAQEVRMPHFLSMTATPIPRTLALAVYGDLDLSLLDEMPKNRKEIITKIVEPVRREETYRFIRDEVRRGRQIFVVCPRIEVGLPAGSPTSPRSGQQKLLQAEVKTVTEEYKKLSERVFPDLKIAMLHGKMKTKEKSAAMKAFQNRETDILVSTSVIEVGVDITNATIMMIEGAERFGLAQLHQFRGRVGRGANQSYCFLFPTEDGAASRRMQAVVEAKNGFELAEKDFQIRGPGDIFGTRQWGESALAHKGMADSALVRRVREEALALIRQSPDLASYQTLKSRLAQMEKALHLE